MFKGFMGLKTVFSLRASSKNDLLASSWDQLGYLRATRGDLVAILGYLGFILGHLGLILGHFGRHMGVGTWLFYVGRLSKTAILRETSVKNGKMAMSAPLVNHIFSS